MSGGKTVYLAAGSEEGMEWRLLLGAHENTKNFTGFFVTYGEETRRKHLIRSQDSAFFQKRLGILMDKYEIDHDWDNGACVTLKTPQEHRNTPFGKSNQNDWIEEEEWIQEK